MLFSLLPLVLICLAIAAVAGTLSWSGPSTRDDRTPPFDVVSALDADARDLPVTIRRPAVPADWKPNSGSRTSAGTALVSNVGWLTSDKRFIQLSQTAAKEDDLVAVLARGDRVRGLGAETVGAVSWVRYERNDHPEQGPIWVAEIDGARVGLSGKADDDEFRRFAEMVAAAPTVTEQAPAPR